jgi:hypothetical protein
MTDDYTHCDLCNRKYNQNAYDKHLTHCEKKNKEAMFKNKGPTPSSQMGSRSGYNNKPMASNNSRPNMNTKYGKK